MPCSPGLSDRFPEHGTALSAGFSNRHTGCFLCKAYQSYLPALIAKEDLADGNSKLEASQSLAEISGPALGGVLVQLFSAPLAIVLDAFSFLVSALGLQLIGQPGPPPVPPEETRPNIWAAIGQGLKELVRHPLLRAFALCNACTNFFGAVIGTVYTLYLLLELHIEPAIVGFIFTASGFGGVLGRFWRQNLPAGWGLVPA